MKSVSRISKNDVMILYQELIDVVNNGNLETYLRTKGIKIRLSEFLPKSFYYNAVHDVLKKINGEAYQPEVVRKIISQEIKKPAAKLTLEILSERNKIQNYTHMDTNDLACLISVRLRNKEIPIEYIKSVVSQ